LPKIVKELFEEKFSKLLNTNYPVAAKKGNKDIPNEEIIN
tara:strand:+ start:3485 stop:3604 length:120 start_codon:yes stop_codon:yes gene_type:complete